MAVRYRSGIAIAMAALVFVSFAGAGAASAAAVPSAAAAVPADVQPEPPEPSPGAPPEPPPDEEPSQPEPDPDPSPEPSPAPGPEPTPPSEDEGAGEQEEPAPEVEGCGMFDYACKVSQAFDGWLISLVAEMVNANLMMAAIGMIYTPPPSSGIEQGWSIALAVTNAVYVLVVVIAGVVVMTNPSVQASTGIKEIVPRLLLGFVGANASWFLCRLMTDVGNGVALSMLGETATADSVATAIGRLIEDPVGELLIVVLLYLVAQVLIVFFFFALLIRIMLWLLLTAVAPIALACHALPQTDGLARMWWRAMGALLVIQVAQALVLRIAVTLFLSREDMDFIDPGGTADSLIDVGLLICCMYVLVRIPFWAFKRVFNYQTSPVVRAAKFAISVLVFRNLGRAVATAAKKPPNASPGRGGRPGSPPPRGPRSGGPRPSGPSGGRADSGRGATPRRQRSRSGGTGTARGPAPGSKRQQSPPRSSHQPQGDTNQQPRQRGTASQPGTGSTDPGGNGRPGATGSGTANRDTGSYFTGTPRRYPGGVSVHRPAPPGPHGPPPDPNRYRPARPNDIRITPPRPRRPDPPPKRGFGSRPIRPRPHHYRRRPKGDA